MHGTHRYIGSLQNGYTRDVPDMYGQSIYAWYNYMCMYIIQELDIRQSMCICNAMHNLRKAMHIRQYTCTQCHTHA